MITSCLILHKYYPTKLENKKSWLEHGFIIMVTNTDTNKQASIFSVIQNTLYIGYNFYNTTEIIYYNITTKLMFS